MSKVIINLQQVQAQGHLTPEGEAGLAATAEVNLTIQALLKEGKPVSESTPAA